MEKSPLSALAQFDDIRRGLSVLLDDEAEQAFLMFVRQWENTCGNWQEAIDGNMRLQRELDTALKSMADLEAKLNNARKLLELENKARREAEQDRDYLEKKLYLVKDLISSNHNLNDETRSKLDFLNKMGKKPKSHRLSAIQDQCSFAEINSTGSILSDLSLTRSEDDFLDATSLGKRRWRKSKSINVNEGTPRKSNKMETQTLTHHTGKEKIVAVSKVTVPQDDAPIMAESCIKAVPTSAPAAAAPSEEPVYKTPMKTPARKIVHATAPPMEMCTPSRGRPHDFEEKNFFMTKICNHCQKNIRFGQLGLRCKTCFINCHPDVCAKNLDIICAPPSAQKYLYAKLSDYVTTCKPMIPALLIHCVNEIEKRGLKEKGLYRVNGSDREIKALKEKFLRSKSVPCLKEVDINVLCGCVKDFLRSLQEKVIPDDAFVDFSNAVQQPNQGNVEKTLKNLVAKLPEANRDTLAFVIIHLRRIAESPEVQMPIDNLAKIFAPTLVGSSSSSVADENRFIVETYLQFEILKALFTISTPFWDQFIQSPMSSDETGYGERYTSNKDAPDIFKNLKRRKRFYDTPPSNKQRK